MKTTVLILVVLLCAPLSLFSQNDDYNTQRGIELFDEKNYEAALGYLQNASKSGSTKAMNLLACMYENGYGVKMDYAIALNLYTKAAAQKDGWAIVSIGRLYEEGKGVPKDALKAYSNYQKSADLHCAEGEYQVSLCKYYGYGTEQDFPQAIVYAERAATNGQGYNGYAARLYFENENYEKAFYWYTHPKPYSNQGKVNLADLYLQGKGTKQDGREAKKLLDELKADGYSEVNLDSMYSIANAVLQVQLAQEERDRQKQEELAAAARRLTPPQFNDAAKSYISNFKEPQKPAIASAGRGEVVISCYVSSSGYISGATIKYRVLQRLDNEALRLVQGMPAIKPGTKGGYGADMRVEIGIEFFPLSVRLLNYRLK